MSLRVLGRGWTEAVVPLALAGLALVAGAGCEPAGDRASPLSVASRPAALRLVGSNVRDGALGLRQALEVELSDTVDPASVGLRSVRIERADGRRLRRLRAWSRGNRVFVAARPGRTLPEGEPLVLRLEGGGSPRSIRSAAGDALAATVELAFRVEARRHVDVVGPRVVETVPAAGALDVRPGGHVELRFDEPLARESLRTEGAIRCVVDGRAVEASARISPDLLRVVVRPLHPLPPGAQVRVAVQPSVLDLAGNPADHAEVVFRTAAGHLHEIVEDFVTTEMVDDAATTCDWAAPEAPGLLVARAGVLRRQVVDPARAVLDLPERRLLHFQVVFPGSGAVSGGAAALRIGLHGAVEGDEIVAAHVAAGPTMLDRADPSFSSNAHFAELVRVAGAESGLDVELDADGRAYVDVPFDMPLPLRPGQPFLVDVSVELPPGLRIAAALDDDEFALVEDGGGLRLLPDVELLVVGAVPQARSRWYDSGTARPAWRAATASPAVRTDGAAPVLEFQTAPSGPDGGPDVERAGDWTADLAAVPALRFVRFRVRFDALGAPGHAPRIGRIVLPYEN